MLRAVLDTNVMVSGTIMGNGPAGMILRAWEEGNIILITSEPLIQEVRRVLAYPRIAKYGITGSEITRVIHALRTYSLVVEGNIHIEVIREDPADNAVLAAAIEGKAEIIISGDQHLLKLAHFEGIPIVTPRAFLAMLKGNS